jgi:prefoldin subunit 5
MKNKVGSDMFLKITVQLEDVVNELEELENNISNLQYDLERLQSEVEEVLEFQKQLKLIKKMLNE